MYVLIHRFKQNYVGLTIEVIFVNMALTHHETLLDRLNPIKQSGRYSLGEGYQSDNYRITISIQKISLIRKFILKIIADYRVS